MAGAHEAVGDDVPVWLERLDHALADVADEHDRARLLLARAAVGARHRSLTITMADADEAAARFDGLGDARGVARAVAFAASVTVELDDVTATLDHLVRALVALEQVHDDETVGDVLNELGIVLHRVGAYERALELYERAGAAARRQGSRWRVERSTHNQIESLLACARLARLVGAPGDHEHRLVRAEGLARELGSSVDTEHYVVEGPRMLADVLCELDRPEEAWLTLLTAPVPDPDTYAYAARLSVEARCLRRLGQAERALAALDAAIALGTVVPEEAEGLFLLEERAQVRRQTGDLVGAFDDMRATMALVWQRQVRQSALAVDRLGALVEAEMGRRHLSRSAEIDPLTDVGNRLALDRRIERSGDRPTVAVLAVDLDGLADVNGRHGQAVGDEVLAAVASLLRIEVRDGDLVARTGGDEFVLLLDGLDDGAARSIAERIERRVSGNDWTTYTPGLAVTVSVGAVAGPGRDARRLVQRADVALYEAKRRAVDRAAS